MKHYTHPIAILLIPLLLVAACKKKEDIKHDIRIAKINTLPISDITSVSATCGGNIIDAGGGDITLRGIVWGTSPHPTIDQNTGISIDGKGIGVFTSYLTDLYAQTTYYVKAYAVNSAGIAYGNQVDFKSSSYPIGMVHCTGSPTEVIDVTNPTTGKTWMDRNLGATRAATSITDSLSYGDLYQWGRFADGHQCRWSTTTSHNLSNTDQPGHGDFILAISTHFDWRSPQNNNLWQGVNGVNNPCPIGFRLPTEAELDAERLSWMSNNAAGAFDSKLRLPATSMRNSGNGSIGNAGGWYWTSTLNGPKSRILLFTIGSAGTPNSDRGNGLAVRCIKD